MSDHSQIVFEGPSFPCADLEGGIRSAGAGAGENEHNSFEIMRTISYPSLSRRHWCTSHYTERRRNPRRPLNAAEE